MIIFKRGLRRTLTDFKKHPWLHLVSVSTITMALLILGFFFMVFRNFETVAEKSSPQLSGTVYLRDRLTREEVAAVKDHILSQVGVEHVQFKNKASVMGELQAFLGGDRKMPTALPGEDLFPDVLEIEMHKDASPSLISDLKSLIGQLPEVSEVDFSEDWLAQFKRIRQFLKFLGILLMVGMVAGCSFIIANFMSVRHTSRRHEIDVIKLIGAGTSFILSPLLWEGFIEGAIGSLIALVLLLFIKVFSSSLLSVQWASLLGMREVLYLSAGQFLTLLAIGISMAFFGSFTVFLRFQEEAK